MESLKLDGYSETVHKKLKSPSYQLTHDSLDYLALTYLCNEVVFTNAEARLAVVDLHEATISISKTRDSYFASLRTHLSLAAAHFEQ